MAEESDRGSLPRPSLLFQVATLPALLIGLGRRRIQGSVVADLISFGSPSGQIAFGILALVAVAYPLVASFAHANVAAFTTIRNGDTFAVAIFPLFSVVYAESLPFMAAAVVLGLFSPALGVLFMVAFVPADLLAATASRELVNLPNQFPFGALLSRLITYAMLWLLAVEIPLRVRAVGDIVANAGRGASTVVVVAARVLATAVLVFIWARSMPWVINPIFNWSALGVVQNAAVNGTWFYGHLIVVAAVVAAVAAALWPGLPASRPAEPVNTGVRPERTRSMAEILIRQTAVAMGFALLSAGLLTTVTEAAILVGGLILMGPVVTVFGDRLPLPASLSGAPQPLRWAIALAVAIGLAVVLLLVFGEALYTGTYTGLMVVLAVTGLVFRLLLDGGPAAVAPRQSRAPQLPATVVTLLSVMTIASLWLAMPAIMLADDCSDFSGAELPSCARLLAAAALMPPIVGALVGAAILSRAMEGKGHPPPPQKKPSALDRWVSPRNVPGSKPVGPYAKPPTNAPPEPSLGAKWDNFWNSLFGR